MTGHGGGASARYSVPWHKICNKMKETTFLPGLVFNPRRRHRSLGLSILLAENLEFLRMPGAKVVNLPAGAESIGGRGDAPEAAQQPRLDSPVALVLTRQSTGSM